MDVLCTDKTGTLTEAKIRLRHKRGAVGRATARGCCELAWLNSHFETGLRSPLDNAILGRGAADDRRLAQARRGAVRFRAPPRLGAGGARRPAPAGRQGRAGGRVRALASRYEEPARRASMPLDDGGARAGLTRYSSSSSDEGFRVLGVAWRDTRARPRPSRASRRGELVFAGFAVFLDPPKAERRRGARGARAQGASRSRSSPATTSA